MISRREFSRREFLKLAAQAGAVLAAGAAGGVCLHQETGAQAGELSCPPPWPQVAWVQLGYNMAVVPWAERQPLSSGWPPEPATWVVSGEGGMVDTVMIVDDEGGLLWVERVAPRAVRPVDTVRVSWGEDDYVW